jgi:hypothetical protein
MKGSTLIASFVLLIGIVFHSAAQPSGSLGRTVLDKQTKQSLELVNVWIEGTTLCAATNAKGYYRIQNIPGGNYSVKFSIISYKEKAVAQVQIKGGDNSLSVLMEEAGFVEVQETRRFVTVFGTLSLCRARKNDEPRL